MDLSINELVARGRLAAEACAWELKLDGCLTRPPTAADLLALGETRARTDAEARALLRGLFADELPSGLKQMGEVVGWRVEEATAVLAAYLTYFKEWQSKKQVASASGVAGAVREAIQNERRISPAKPG